MAARKDGPARSHRERRGDADDDGRGGHEGNGRVGSLLLSRRHCGRSLCALRRTGHGQETHGWPLCRVACHRERSLDGCAEAAKRPAGPALLVARLPPCLEASAPGGDDASVASRSTASAGRERQPLGRRSLQGGLLAHVGLPGTLARVVPSLCHVARHRERGLGGRAEGAKGPVSNKGCEAPTIHPDVSVARATASARRELQPFCSRGREGGLCTGLGLAAALPRAGPTADLGERNSAPEQCISHCGLLSRWVLSNEGTARPDGLIVDGAAAPVAAHGHAAVPRLLCVRAREKQRRVADGRDRCLLGL